VRVEKNASYTSLTFNCTGALLLFFFFFRNRPAQGKHVRRVCFRFCYSFSHRPAYALHRRRSPGMSIRPHYEFSTSRVHQSNIETIITRQEQLITLWFMIVLAVNEHSDCVSMRTGTRAVRVRGNITFPKKIKRKFSTVRGRSVRALSFSRRCWSETLKIWHFRNERM